MANPNSIVRLDTQKRREYKIQDEINSCARAGIRNLDKISQMASHKQLNKEVAYEYIANVEKYLHEIVEKMEGA